MLPGLPVFGEWLHFENEKFAYRHMNMWVRQAFCKIMTPQRSHDLTKCLADP